MNIRLAHVLVDRLCFTNHGHGDVKLTMCMHDMRLDRPNARNSVLSLHSMYAISLDQRLLNVLKM